MGKILFNDTIIERKKIIDIEDRGYQFGDGIYEVIGVYGGKLFMLDEHLERLERSAKELQLALPVRLTILKEKIVELVSTNGLHEGVVYLQISRGVAERWHQFPSDDVTPVLVAYTKVEETLSDAENHGAKAVLTEDIRWLRCDIKTLNLLPNVLAKQKAIENNAVEAILHRGDIITEASASNVFIVKSGELYTHPADNYILNGITRRKIFALCEKLNMKVNEETFTVAELLRADEVFVTATKLDIIPIIKVDDTIIGDGKPGDIVRNIVEAYRHSIQELVSD
ncbi:D-amino-acid transaminase [Oceanobacillus bengalensis]|uniref:D-alanine aminotransferase n=1 Tax=Oceanobacillus bengalensis TaxID=1435466 RepID=A0A494YXH4_9BACI|nr:D-amino-acid transaminase [Oceanobacillus bengalensis]RKQ14934.1 D-amino-acid transaminase [Oceanobacillus bengalensis]